MRNIIAIAISCFLVSTFSCKEDKDEQTPSIQILAPSENAEFSVLGEVIIRANVSDNEIVERVQVSLISDVSRNKVLPTRSFEVGQKEYLLDFAFQISDSLLASGRYYFQIEAFDSENSISAFRYINIRGMNTEKTGVFVTCDNGSTSELYFDSNQFNFQQIHQFGARYQGSVFNRFNQQFWFLPKNGNTIEMFDPVKKSVEFTKVYNSNFPIPFSTIKKEGSDVIFTVRELGAQGFNQSLNRNYSYLISASKMVESLGIGEEFNVVEVVNRNGTNRTINVLNKASGVNLNSRTIFDDVVDFQFIDDKNVLVFCNTPSGGKAYIFNSLTATLQSNLFTSDSIRQVVKTNVGDFVISTKSRINTYRPSNNSLANYLTIREAVLGYDELNNHVYVGFGSQLRVYNYRQVTPFQSTTLPNKIVGINVKINQF